MMGPSDRYRKARSRSGRWLTSHPVRAFIVSGVMAFVVIALAAGIVIDRWSQSDAVGDAEAVTALFADTVVSPLINDELLALNAVERADFGRALAPALESAPFLRVKIWRGDGTIVFSDEPRLVGLRFPLDADEQAVLDGKSGTAAGLSDLSLAENQFESQDELLEVYALIRSASGQTAMFEGYVPYQPIHLTGAQRSKQVLAAAVLALLVLWLFQATAGTAMARRLRATNAEHEALLVRALDASAAERRRISVDLHNGVLQSMAGVSYALQSADRLVPEHGPPALRARLDEAHAATRSSIRDLRGLLVELHQPAPEDVGIGAALEDLLVPLRARGLSADLTVSVDEVPPGAVQDVVYQTAQEALRNIEQHAGASAVLVDLRTGPEGVVLDVFDDGCGVGPSRLQPEDAPSPSHLGLRLVSELARGVDGRLKVTARPGGGTHVELRVPLAPGY